MVTQFRGNVFEDYGQSLWGAGDGILSVRACAGRLDHWRDSQRVCLRLASTQAESDLRRGSGTWPVKAVSYQLSAISYQQRSKDFAVTIGFLADS